MFNKMFGNIEKKTGVKMNDVIKLAQSIQNANFQDENTVRGIVKKVGLLANRPVFKQKEDMIVKAIVNGKVPKDFSEIDKMVKKK